MLISPSGCDGLSLTISVSCNKSGVHGALTVSEGAILDVSLDLRKESNTYGVCFAIELSAENFKSVYIPAGVAHAFYVLSESATVAYQVGKPFSANADSGILWDSVDYKWPNSAPIISVKDGNLCELKYFSSPF